MFKKLLSILLCAFLYLSCSQEKTNEDVNIINSSGENNEVANHLSDSLAIVALVEKICALSGSCVTINAVEFRANGGYSVIGFSPMFCSMHLMNYFWFDTTKNREMVDQCYEALNTIGAQCIENDSQSISKGGSERYTLLPSACSDLISCNSGPCND